MNSSVWLRSGIACGAVVGVLVAAGLATQMGQPGRQGDRPGMSGQPGEMRQHDRPDHIMLNKDDLEWKDGPESLAEGAQFAVMEGDPSAAGPFTMRLKLPADFEIAAHTHPAIEHVTVMSGAFHMGKGDELDRSSGTELKPGGFAVMQVGTQHYAWVGDEETVVQLHGIGPWDIYYLDPSDDPRNK